jgi:hypothetical protein
LAALALAPAPAVSSWLVPGPTDAELEAIVRSAYTAATAHAARNANYFARDGEFVPLRDAIASAMAGQPVSVAADAAADIDSARRCAAPGTTELRIVPTLFGDGIGLAAASDTRAFAYLYDPHENAEILVAAAEPCLQG